MGTDGVGRHPTEGDQRPLDALLAGYAAGSLTPALHALVASHLSLTPCNRAYVSTLETMATAELTGTAPVPVSGRTAKLAAIFNCPQLLRRTAGKDNPIPPPLGHYIGHTFSDIRWRSVLPGLKEYRVGAGTGEEATLLWIKAGRRIPSHTHEGTEFTLVLKGGFADLTGHYQRGDIAVADADVDHKPVADADQDCFCFAVTDGRLRLTGLLGKVVERIFGSGH